MNRRIPRSTSFITGLLAFSTATPAFAYLDPGTGSVIIQGLIAGIAMVGVTARMYWHRLQVFFGRGPGDEKAEEPREPNTAEPSADHRPD